MQLADHCPRRFRYVLLFGLWATLLALGAALAQSASSSGPPERRPPPMSPGASKVGDQRADLPSGVLTKVEPALLKQLLASDPDKVYRFIVEMSQKTDLTSLPGDLSRVERQHRVVAGLRATAGESQSELLAYLVEGKAKGQVQEIQPFWVFNGLAVTADAHTVLALAARPDVRIVREDRWRRWVEPSPATPARSESSAGDAEWNIARIRADEAWNALDITGSGVTVAILDTGVDWQHPALQSQYRGYKPGGLAIHDGNWACTTDEGYQYPVDGHSHGTHAAGTAVGGRDAGGTAIGVAPGAFWIAVKMLDDAGYAYDSWIHAAFQWVLAPDGDPSLAPQVVNGSWGSPNGADDTFRADLGVLRAAGIAPVFAAGNEGPGASTLRSPASYPETIAVGATDDIDEVAGFSSQGPSHWDEVKPEVAAPGTQIRSSLPGGAYGLKQGTSMAAPHVAGLVALMLEARPGLTLEEIEEILASTAVPLGEPLPNNHSGWGRVDAYEATAVSLDAGYVNGEIKRLQDLQPLTGAQVYARDHIGSLRAKTRTDSSGSYRLALPEGQFNLSFAAFGYKPQELPGVEIESGMTVEVDIVLLPAPSGVLWGEVRDAETTGPVSAVVRAVGTPAESTSDPHTGQYSMVLPAGSYSIEAVRNGYRHSRSDNVEVVVDQAERLDLDLVPSPTLLLIDSGPWYYGSHAGYYEQALDDRDYVYDLMEIRDPEADVPTLEDLGAYDTIVWSAPLDAPGLVGAGDVISNYLGTGGSLFLSGQDVGFWDGGLTPFVWHPYYGQFLKAKAVMDDAGRDDVLGTEGDILQGLSLSMNGPESAENQVSPDLPGLTDPHNAAVVGRYTAAGDAAIRASGCQSYRSLYLAPGLEGLGGPASRAELMERSIAWLGTPHPEVALRLDPYAQSQTWITGSYLTHTVELQNTGRITDGFELELSTSAWPASVWDAGFSEEIEQTLALGACQTQTLGLRVDVPPGIHWNLSDTVTLTARSQADPSQTASATAVSKAPAPILLVDDHRWFEVSASYQGALRDRDLPFDLWSRDSGLQPDGTSPSLQRLECYPVVAWFTAYDWHETLAPEEEARLAAYLDQGGRLLFSSQDYLYTSGFTSFARDYLGVAQYTESLSATQVLGALESPVAKSIGPAPLDYPFQNYSDSLRPALPAQIAYWGQHGQPVALTAREKPWKTAFFAFPLEALEADDMSRVLGQAVDWLSPLGDSEFSADRRAASAGDELAYELIVRNTSPRPLAAVSLSNTVPAYATFVGGSLLGPATYDPVENRVSWSGPLAPDQEIRMEYRVQLDGPLPDGLEIENVAYLRDESGLGLNLATRTRVGAPDLSRSVKTSSTTIAAPQQVVTFTLSLYNDGLGLAQVCLEDPVPAHGAYLTHRASASGGTLTPTEETLLWRGDIPPHDTVTITAPVSISPGAPGLYVLNRATLSDGWGAEIRLEAFTWAGTRIHLPTILRQ